MSLKQVFFTAQVFLLPLIYFPASAEHGQICFAEHGSVGARDVHLIETAMLQCKQCPFTISIRQCTSANMCKQKIYQTFHFPLLGSHHPRSRLDDSLSPHPKLPMSLLVRCPRRKVARRRKRRARKRRRTLVNIGIIAPDLVLMGFVSLVFSQDKEL